jgi:hypothetical protein
MVNEYMLELLHAFMSRSRVRNVFKMTPEKSEHSEFDSTGNSGLDDMTATMVFITRQEKGNDRKA